MRRNAPLTIVLLAILVYAMRDDLVAPLLPPPGGGPRGAATAVPGAPDFTGGAGANGVHGDSSTARGARTTAGVGHAAVNVAAGEAAPSRPFPWRIRRSLCA